LDRDPIRDRDPQHHISVHVPPLFLLVFLRMYLKTVNSWSGISLTHRRKSLAIEQLED